MLFGGNLLRQPAFVNLIQDKPEAIRTVGEMRGADKIMINTLFIGTYPGLTEEMLDMEIKVIGNYIKNKSCQWKSFLKQKSVSAQRIIQNRKKYHLKID